jgi:hypothetical protein
MFGPHFEEMLDLMQSFPELRAPMARSCKDVVGINVFHPYQFCPDGIILLVKFPNPFRI